MPQAMRGRTLTFDDNSSGGQPMTPIIISISVAVLALIIWIATYYLESPKKARTSSHQENADDISEKLILPRPPAVSSNVENKIDWVMKCAAALDKAIGCISGGNEFLAKDSVKSNSDSIRLLAYHYEELASIGGLNESMYEHGKKEIKYSMGGKTAKALLTFLWEFFCCGYELIYSDEGFRAWSKREDIPKSNSLIQLRILLLILLNSFEADQ